MRSKYLSMAQSEALRLDAGESAIAARELDYIEAEVTRKAYPDLKSKGFVPMIGGVPAGAKNYYFKILDLKGYAKLIGNDPSDLPDVDVSQEEIPQPIRSFGARFRYTVDEVREFALAKSRGSSISLDMERANAARLMCERKVDDVIAVGEANVPSLTGFLNNANVPLVAPITGGWVAAINAATPATIAGVARQVLADMHKIERTVFSQSKELAPADVLLLPLDEFAVVSQTPLGDNTDKSILSYFLSNALSIKEVRPWYRLKTAGAGSTTRAVAYKRDPMVAGYLNPLVFEALPPQALGLAFNIPCHSKCGGTVVRFPLGMAYMDGI